MGGLRLPLDFSSGAVWGFWFGIAVAFAGVGIAVASYIADAQTNARIQAVQIDAQRQVDAAKAEARSRIDRVEQSTAERRLNPEQVAAFEELFDTRNRHIKMFVVAGLGSGEVAGLMSDIKTAAKSAHAGLPPFDPVVGSVMPPGISFIVARDDSDSLRRINRFSKRLNLNVTYTVGGDPKGTIGVAIGSRADGFP